MPHDPTPHTNPRPARARPPLWLGAALALIAALIAAPARAGSPYPASPVISGITFDFTTHDRRAPGSDNWPMTWADDDNQYTSWGDGGGFEGTNTNLRVSLGVAVVSGTADDHAGSKVWSSSGKSYGMLSVAGILYMWVSPGSNATGYNEARIYRSGDHGASWVPATWAFTQSDGLIFPTFLQFGKDYAGARDGYVYAYANHLKDPSALTVHKPGEIALMRVPKESILDRARYEFYAGRAPDGTPQWTPTLSARQPVFQDPDGVGWNTSAGYDAGLGRYFLITEHTATVQGNIGIFDAPEPWGPWTTVLYTSAFGSPDVDANTFFWNFAPKWYSPDGRQFVLVFTGVGNNDSWNTVKGTFTLNGGADTTPPGAPTGVVVTLVP